MRKIHTNKIAPDDFAGTTVTLTNPGTLGTVQSVPRLMPGQGLIVGVGALGFPPGFEAADPRTPGRPGHRARRSPSPRPTTTGSSRGPSPGCSWPTWPSA